MTKTKSIDKIYVLCDGMGVYKGGEIAAYECSMLLSNRFEKTSFDNFDEAKCWLFNSIKEAAMPLLVYIY